MTDEKIARLRISLEDTEPQIWRVVEVPLTSSLKAVHDVVQAAMGWEDCHLWEFRAGERRYGVPDPRWGVPGLAAAKGIKLAALVGRDVRELLYVYDIGDDWRHQVVIEAVEPADPSVAYPRFLSGARRAPPEDVGGTMGFDLFLEAMADPSHEEHARLLEWHGGPYDPDDIEEPLIQFKINKLAQRRAVGKAGTTRAGHAPDSSNCKF